MLHMKHIVTNTTKKILTTPSFGAKKAYLLESVVQDARKHLRTGK